ncbi:hypothetical protein BGZ47_008085 [Haplosporangium gracile]|nr:hypothetical protein BGZ47_008085 [Haplosporangium gracile]
MGRIKLDCIAVNPNNTIIYGIGNAFIDGTQTFIQEKGALLLVRSDPNPTAFRNIKWNIFAMIPAQYTPNYWSQSFDSVDCAVSRTGAFTALAVYQKTYQTQGTIEWMGVKYDPAKDVPGGNNSSQGRSSGWEWFGTGTDYRWSQGSLWSHAAIYLDQRVKVEGGPVEGVIRERFIHVAAGEEGELRLGSFGPKDQFSSDTISTWSMNSSLVFPQAPKFVRIGQGHAHVYRAEAGTITSYPLTDVASFIPAGIVTKTLEGLSLQHIIPGVRNGTSYLACIGTNSNHKQQIFFVSNYLETNNTITDPHTSQLYDIDTSSASSTAPLRPYQFVTSQYMASSVSTTTVLNIFQFGISLSAEGHIRGINLSGNATSNTFGQTANTGAVYVDAPYSSDFGPPPSISKEDSPDSITPRKLAGILGGLAMVILLALIIYKLWKKRKNRKLRAIEAEAAAAESDRLGPIFEGGHFEPARYQPPYYRQRQGIETPAVSCSQQPQQQHGRNQPSARHDGPDVPPPYSA